MNSRPLNNPKNLWTSAERYFAWCEKHPLMKEEIRGEKKVRIKKIRPFTWGGLANHLGCSVTHLRQLHSNNKFSDTLARIHDIIYAQLFECAAVGIFDANLVIRYLKIGDSHDIKLNIHLK